MTATTRHAYPGAVVDPDWPAKDLRDPSLRVFDCTTHLNYETVTGRPYRVESGRGDYDKGHIPGSAFLDPQGEFSDASSRFNFTMPAVDDLAARFAAKGIGAGTRVTLARSSATASQEQAERPEVLPAASRRAAEGRVGSRLRLLPAGRRSPVAISTLLSR